MNNAVLAYFHKGRPPRWFEPHPGVERLRVHAGRATLGPSGQSDSGGDWYDIDLAFDNGICRIEIAKLGGRTLPYLERALAHPGPAGNGAAPMPTGGEGLHVGAARRLDDGDRLRFGEFYVQYIATSRYLQYLPGPYHTNTGGSHEPPTNTDGSHESPQFTGRFLMIFESILDPIGQTIGQLDQYFSPSTAPATLLPYLLTWFGLTAHGATEQRQRELLRQAVEINRRRSTRIGLSMHIAACCNITPEIVEWSAGRAGPGMPGAPNSFTVILPLGAAARPAGDRLIRMVDAIIREHCPVHATYELWTRTQDGQLQRAMAAAERGVR